MVARRDPSMTVGRTNVAGGGPNAWVACSTTVLASVRPPAIPIAAPIPKGMIRPTMREPCLTI